MNLVVFTESLLRDKGASYNLTTGDFNPNKGYFVSDEDNEVIISLEDFSNDPNKYVIDFIRTNIDKILLDSNTYIGGWINGDEVYLDISRIYYTIETAIQSARKNHQLAIFNNAVKQVITI